MCTCVSSALTSLHFLNGRHRLLSASSNLDVKNNVQLELPRKSNPKHLIKVSSNQEDFQLYNEELGLGFQFEEDDDIQMPSQDNSSISSQGYDFLEFEKSEIHLFEDQDELVQLETPKSKSNVMARREETTKLRKGRQLVRRSSILAKQVISLHSALALGFVSQLWVDTCSWVVVVVEVRPSMLSGEMERLLLEDVRQVGDVVLVEDESVLEDIKLLGLDTLVGYNVVTPSRRSIGKVRGFTFSIESGAVELLELDSFGISVIPSSLVSTYGLFIEDVIDVESDTLVVHEAVASRIQRLTKGFWDTNMETFNEQLKEYPDTERRSVQSTPKSNREKSTTTKYSEDDLQLPMDYL